MDKIIFFTILTLFPFGQLFKIGIVNLFDVSILVLAIITIFLKPKYPSWYKYFLIFTFFAFFSWIINYFIFNSPLFFNGLMYLFRLLSYSFVAIYILNFYKSKKTLLNKLLAISIFSAIFGWVQYLVFPDLTALKYLGWDDHLLRMVGTFLDPTFLGLIIVLGIIVALREKHKKITLFLIISLAFTYSRISYLILFLVLIYKRKYVGTLALIFSIFLLPKMIGEGTNLTRTSSGYNKLINYKETVNIIKESPLIGVGFNNICFARQTYLNDVNLSSHACNGSDSSLLFIIATTGVIGLILFINFIFHVPYSQLLLISFIAVLIHSQFANSLFYPHIMFWLFSLIGLGSKVDS